MTDAKKIDVPFQPFNMDALNAGAALATFEEVPGYHPFSVVPLGYEVRSLEKLEKDPPLTRRKGELTLIDAESFIGYVTRYSGSNTVILANTTQGAFQAVFDYHSPGPDGLPGHRGYRAEMTMIPTREWKTWAGKNKAQFTQVEFAEFLEANLLDIASPSSASLIEVATKLEATKSVKFSGGVRLDNGQVQLSYIEEIQGGSRDGKLKIPDMFTLNLKPFEGSETYALEARLRYRISDKGVTFFYDMVRPHKVQDDAIQDVVKRISAETGVPVFKASF